MDVKQEKRIDDYWNIDGSRYLSDPWTGFTQFTLLDEKAPDGYMWSGARLTRKQLTSRPDHLWPELWKSMGKNAKLKEKQKWSEEKIHLENARKLRGIYFIDPEDKEFKETIKNARKKLETSVAPAMPCKIMKNCGNCVTDENKQDNSESYAVFTEQGSSASQMTAAKIMDIISRLLGCDGQAADAVSIYTQVKMEDAHKLLKIPKSECPDIWIRLPRHKWPKSWSGMEDPVVPLERNLYGHPLAGLLWERQFEKILLKHGWEKFQIGNVSLFIVKKDYSYLCMWMT